MHFKEALGIEDTSWIGISNHLSKIVSDTLKKTKKSPISLQEHLISKGFPDIKLDYIETYLQGKCSFGCFFHYIREFLNIPKQTIFRNSQPDFGQQNLSGLEAYLGELSLESIEHLLIYPRGEAMRRHLVTYFKQRYEEPDQNLCYVMTLEGSPLGYNELIEKALAEIRAEENETELTEFFFDNCNLRVFPHKNGSYTVHFVPKPAVMDLMMQEEGINLEAWRDIYEKSSFAKVRNNKQLFNLFAHLGGGDPMELVPRRNSSDPEFYEVFCRLGLYNRAGRGELQKPTHLTVSSTGTTPKPAREESIYETYRLHAFMEVSKLLTNNLLELVK